MFQASNPVSDNKALLPGLVLFSLVISVAHSCGPDRRDKEKIECLSDRKLRHIKNTFESFAYGDGTISDSKLKEIARKIGTILTDREIREMKRQIDLNGNGKVEFIEFKKKMERTLARGNTNWNLFLSIDTNHDSMLSEDEWKKFQEKVGGNPENFVVRQWMTNADKNNDSKV